MANITKNGTSDQRATANAQAVFARPCGLKSANRSSAYLVNDTDSALKAWFVVANPFDWHTVANAHATFAAFRALKFSARRAADLANTATNGASE